LRSDDMEYHVRPLDHKHPVILPVGQEAEFKVNKDKLDMRVPEGNSDSRKRRHYQVVAMKPIDHPQVSALKDSQYNVPRKDDGDKPLGDKSYQDQNVGKPPVQPSDHPQ
jgi:hypothetical protein